VGRKTHRLGSEKEEWGKGRRRETHSDVEKSSQSAVIHNAEIVRTSKFIFIFTIVTQNKDTERAPIVELRLNGVHVWQQHLNRAFLLKSVCVKGLEHCTIGSSVSVSISQMFFDS
jgi:hypothetical protein